MSKVIRMMLSLVVGVILFSVVPMAHASENNADQHKHKTGEHHSRFSKLAFWRHHKGSDKNLKAAQANHAKREHVPVKEAQSKTPSHTVAAKNQKQGQHSGSKAPANKASVPSKTKPHEKAQDHTTASLKQ